MATLQTLRDAAWVLRATLPFTAYPYSGSSASCPVCADDRQTTVARFDRRLKRLGTVACQGCGLLRSDPMPSEADLERYYSRLYRFDYQMALSGPRPRQSAKRRREAIIRRDWFIDLLPGGARTLDFGAGSGEFVTALLEKGFDAHGFEPGKGHSSWAASALGNRIRCARWQDVEFSEEFDLVTSCHVFEHLRSPAEAFAAVASWLKPGGIAYIEVPNSAYELELKGFGSLHYAHVVGFNRYNLCLAAASAGLVPVRHPMSTGIVFRKDPRTDADLAGLAARGAQLTHSILQKRPTARAYLNYQLGKLAPMREAR